jgi:outer membrane usher protein
VYVRLRRSLCLAIALAVTAPAWAQADTVAGIVLDGVTQSEGDVLQLKDGQPLLPLARLREWGLVPPPGTPDPVAVQDAGFRVTFDAAGQVYWLSAPATWRVKQTFRSGRVIDRDLSPSPKGVLLSYDLAARKAMNGDTSVSAGYTASANLATGVLTATGQINRQADGRVQGVRGLTTWSKDTFGGRDQNTRVQLGDVFTPTTPTQGAVDLRGVQWGTDRALEEAVYAVPVIGGVADTRTSAEVWANGVRQEARGVAAGPWELTDYRVDGGVNRVQAIVRDEYGREQTIDKSFYATDDALRPGQVQWNAALGQVRTGGTGEDYGTTAAQGALRVGVSPWLTLGASGQATRDERNLAVQATLNLGLAGRLSLERARGGEGAASAWSYERRAPHWTLQAGETRQGAAYWDLTAERTTSGLSTRMATTRSAGVAVHPRGRGWNVGLSYDQVTWQGDREPTERASLTAGLRGRQWSLNAAFRKDLDGRDDQVGLTYTYRFAGSQRLATTSVQHADDRTRVAQTVAGSDAVAGRQVRWNATVATGPAGTAYQSASASMPLARGTGQLDLYHAAQGTQVNGRYRGGVWLGEGGVQNTGPVYGGYVVAEVPGQANVPVSAQGQPALTNTRGVAILPNVGALHDTPVRVDPSDLPVDTLVPETTRRANAPRRGGAKVVFEVKSDTLREFRLIDERHRPIDDGTVVSDTETARVGRGGVLVLSQPQAGQTLTIADQCTATLPSPLPVFLDAPVAVVCTREK